MRRRRSAQHQRRYGRRVVAVAWLRSRDPGFAALRRASRSAIVMPALFALGVKVIENPTVATFSAFGAFAMLLLADFRGAMRDRLRNQIALAVACGALIAIATLVSQTSWLAAVAMAVVGFGVLFAGVASSVLAGATQTLLLAFILPVSLAAPAAAIPDRLAGWGLAAACSLPAIRWMWPAPERDPVRSGAIDACRALAARLRAEAENAAAASKDAIDALHATFFATPFRPTGLSTSARAVVRLVDELRWLDEIVIHAAPQSRARAARRDVCAIWDAAARVLEVTADMLGRPERVPAKTLQEALADLSDARARLERLSTVALPSDP